MMRTVISKRHQRGYFLIIAVLLVMVISVMGIIISYSFSNRAKISVAQQQGLQAFYIAETGLEIASRLLVGTNLVSGQGLSCATLTGSSLVTNSAVLNGTFTATAVGGALYSASTSLSAGITATSNSMSVADVTGMAPHGRVRIDSEAIDYASISGTTLIGLNRGVSGTTAVSHSSGASVSQSVCLVNVQAGIPSIASPVYQRQLEMAVEILGGSEMWAVAARHGNQFSIVRWNNPIPNAWNDVSPPADTSNREDLYSISMSSTTNGWAVGAQKGSNFTMVRWSGSLPWIASPLAGACNGQDLKGVAITSTVEGWAVGLRYRPSCANNGNYRYTFMKWNGSSWSLLTPSSSPSIPADAAGNPNLNEISVFDSNGDGAADYGFAVGDSGSILRYTGSSWVNSTSGVSANLYGVYVVSGSEAWAVGAGGVILKWNGSTWSSISSPTGNQLNAISMVDANGDGVAEAGWAVGNSGTIIYYNGSTWTTQSSSTTNNLSSVAAVSGSLAYVVGLSNTLLQFSGGSWTTATPPTSFTATYYDISYVRGGGISATGSLVGSWQQVFH
jgi:hypothetical protein